MNIRTLNSGLTAILILACSCTRPIGKEVLRAPSPDNRVDAVLMEVNGGATTSYSYNLYIVPSGDNVDGSDYPVLTADHIKGQKIHWPAPRTLEIQYDQARIFHFENFWDSREVDNFKYEVQIREKQAESGQK